MDSLSFDCNVHPAKREVRLHRPDQVRQAVYAAAKLALDAFRTPVEAAPKEHSMAHGEVTPEVDRYSPSRSSFAPPPQMDLPAMPQPERLAEEDAFRLLEGLGGRWILMEGAEGLVLLDVRAASERILFEGLRREAALGHVSSQRLLLLEIVELTPKDAVWISENQEALQKAGFLVEAFGGSSFKVEALPSCLSERDARAALLDVCETLRSTGLLGSGQPVLDALVRSVSRIAALNGFDYEESRARRLVRELLKCELPYACPQGRPTMIQWSFSELDRKFGR
jgi:DNA mismatch repair protein MutL